MLDEKCDRSCEGCCNKDWDTAALPVALPHQFQKYEMIMLTGGEPLLDPVKVLWTISLLRKLAPKAKIVVYTACVTKPAALLHIAEAADGITLTLHDESDVPYFYKAEALMRNHDLIRSKSMRLNVFKGIVVLEDWWWISKKNIEWIKDCPLPDNEDFMRLEPA